MQLLLHFYGLFLTLLDMATAQQLTLEPSQVAPVVEGQNLTMTCSITGAINQEDVGLNWYQNGVPLGTMRVTNGSPCALFGLIRNNSVYSAECKGSNVFAVTIIRVNRSINNASWKCEMVWQSATLSSPLTSIEVHVGITGVSMNASSLIKMIENTQGTIQCDTSGGLPSAKVTWYMNSGAGFLDVSSDSSSSSKTADGLSVVTSTLRLSPSRNSNNVRVYCSARNVGSTYNSTTATIEVLYGPDTPQCHYRGSTLTGNVMITLGSALSINCTSNSNPPPAGYKWTLPDTKTQLGSQLDVTILQTAQSGPYILQVWNTMTPTGATPEYGTKTTTISVDVQYSPSQPTFSISSVAVNGTVKIIEGVGKTIRCVSESNPPANFTWTYPGGTSTKQELLLSSPRSPNDAGDYECRAENTLTPTGGPVQSPLFKSSRLTVDILFPARSTSFKYGSTNGTTLPGNTISIVRGASQPVACTANSNPQSSFQWEGQGIAQLLNLNTFQTTTHKTCTVKTTMVETVGETKTTTNTTSLSITVFYPPDDPQVQFYYQVENTKVTVSSIRVLEGESFFLQCIAESNPPSAYSWNNMQASSAGVYTITNISRTPSQQEAKCTANNTMVTTFSGSVEGIKSRTINISVLYGPKTLAMQKLNIVLGSRVEKNCSYIPGNPTDTSFKWARTTTSGAWIVQTTQILLIANVQRSDDSNYTCQVSNVLNPTGGSLVTKTDEGKFHLNVLFGPEKIKFTVQGYSGQTTVTVNEGEKHTLMCSLESNPSSSITIIKDGVFINDAVNQLNHAVTVSSKCEDAGSYSCTGSNNYGQAQANMVQLFVNCAARLSPYAEKKNVSSAQNVNTTLSFYAQAYPLPRYVWQTCTSTCTNINDGVKFKMSSNGLVSNLTILDVKKEDYGEYRVIVSNGIGVAWTEPFTLIPYDKPNKPTMLHVVENTVTQTEATLAWIPGFDGGPRQTFHIQYRVNPGGSWKEAIVNDNGNKQLNETIRGLVPNTEYQAYMYSVNIIGNSSDTETITLVTLKEPSPVGPSTPGALIGGVVGGAVVAIIIVVIVVVLLRKRQGSHQKKKDGFTGELMKTNREQNDDIPDEVRNPMYISAGDVTNETAVPEYASPVKKKPAQLSTDVYATVDVNKKKAKAKPDVKKDKGKKTKDKQPRVDVYENPQLGTSKKAYDNKGMDENLYENNATVGSTRKNVSADGLIYADLDFPNQPKGQKRLVIHGLDNKTDYAEVDLTRTAEPLPDSDSEEKKIDTKQ